MAWGDIIKTRSLDRIGFASNSAKVPLCPLALVLPALLLYMNIPGTKWGLGIFRDLSEIS